MNPFQHQSSKNKKLYTFILLLSIAALILSLLLIQTHYQVSEKGSYCNINDYWNCDRVNKSLFAVIFGIPVAIFGFLYYLFLSVFSFGLLKGWDFQKIISPFKTKWLLTATLAVTSLMTLGLMWYESFILGNMFFWGIIKNLLFLISFFSVFRFTQRSSTPVSEIIGVLTICSLFGVNFSLYLTDIELFVLEAICIFCFSQQILIVIISAFSLIALNKNKNDSSKSTSESGKLGRT